MVVIRSPRIDGSARVLTVATEPTKRSSEKPLMNEDGESRFIELDDEKSAEEERLRRALEEAEKKLATVETELQESRADLDRLVCELEKKTKVAVADGYKNGYEEGLNRAREERSEYIAQLASLLRSIEDELRKELDGVIEDSAVEIVFSATAKIVGEAMRTSEGIVAVVREAINCMSNRLRLKIHVAPEDSLLVRESIEQLATKSDGSMFSVVADSRVTLGGCIVESDAGTLDARLDAQFDAMRKMLIDIRKKRQ